MLTKHCGEFYLVMGALVFAFNGVISTVVLDHLAISFGAGAFYRCLHNLAHRYLDYCKANS